MPSLSVLWNKHVLFFFVQMSPEQLWLLKLVTTLQDKYITNDKSQALVKNPWSLTNGRDQNNQTYICLTMCLAKSIFLIPLLALFLLDEPCSYQFQLVFGSLGSDSCCFKWHVLFNRHKPTLTTISSFIWHQCSWTIFDISSTSQVCAVVIKTYIMNILEKRRIIGLLLLTVFLVE